MSCAVADDGTDEISQYREQLEALLWDLDDYLEVDTFEAEIYDQLAGLVRTAVLKIADVLVRMKLERPIVSPIPVAEVVKEGSPNLMMEAKAGPVEEWKEANGGDPVPGGVAGKPEPGAMVVNTPEPEPAPEPFRPEDILGEPDVNPWAVTEPVPDIETETGDERRLRVDTGGDPDPVSPLTPVEGTRRVLGGWAEQATNHHSSLEGVPIRPISQHSDAGSIRGLIQSAVSHNQVHDRGVSPLTETNPGPTPAIASQSSYISTANQPAANLGQPPSHTASSLSIATATSQASSSLPQPEVIEQPGLEVVSDLIDDGLIPVTTEAASVRALSPVLDCSIGPNSSFAHYKGFCEGANEALSAGAFGVKKDRRV